MQVNVLSTTLLALLLIPKLKATNKLSPYTPVLEIVGSSSSWTVRDLVSTDAPFAAYNMRENFAQTFNGHYGTSKLFVNYVQESLVPLVANQETGKPDVFVTVVCPGACKSDIAREATAWYYQILVRVMAVIVLRPAENGARTYISGIDQGEKLHGKFWKDDAIRP